MQKIQSKFFKSNFGLIFIICVLTFSIYSFSLEAPFKTMDDEASIVRNVNIQSFSNIGKVFSTSFFGLNAYYRPMVIFSFMIEYHFFGLNPLFYNLTNLFIHILSAICIFFFIKFIFKDRFKAFLVSLLFAVHPIHWEAVSNIPGRAILLSAFFSFVALFLFALRDKNKILYFLSMICFVFSVLSKESGGMLPVMLLSYLLFIERKPKVKLTHLFIPVLPFFFIEFIYLIFRRALGVTKLFYWRSFDECLLGFLTFLRSVITHIRVFFFPVDLQFDRARKLFESVANFEVLLTILFFAVPLFYLFKFRDKISSQIWFFILWFWIELFPVSQFLVSVGVQPHYISTAEHFLYTPSIGFFVILVIPLIHFYNENKKKQYIKPEVFRAAVLGFISFLVLMTIQQNIYSSQETSMLERTVKFNPMNARIRYNLAMTYANQRRIKDAEMEFRKVIEITPDLAKPRVGLGKALADQGRYWESIREYEKISDAGHHQEMLENNIRLTYRALEEKYSNRLKSEPNNPQIYYSLGVVFSKTEKYEQAIKHYLQAISIKPNYKNALFNLASSYKMINDDIKAIEYYKQMIGLQANINNLDYIACLHLAEIYQKQGNMEHMTYYNNLADQLKAQSK